VVSTRVSPEDLREIDAVADRMQAGRAEVLYRAIMQYVRRVLQDPA
jgi:predicted transcriptional regulator